MKTTHLDNEINRLKWLKRKGDLSPIGENTLIEYEAIKQALATLNAIPDVVEQTEQYFCEHAYDTYGSPCPTQCDRCHLVENI